MPADDAPPLDAAALADRLKQARAAASFTQRDLAKRAGVSPTVINLMESGQPHSWQPLTLANVARALGKPWHYLGAHPPPTAPFGTSAYKLAVARLSHGLSLRQMSAIT